jgi:hypothetical protein
MPRCPYCPTAKTVFKSLADPFLPSDKFTGVLKFIQAKKPTQPGCGDFSTPWVDGGKLFLGI